MDGKLLRLKITQAEMYDLGNIEDIDHYILYDSGSKIAIDITSEINQAPLLSKVSPYNIVMDTSGIEDLINGTFQMAKSLEEAGGVPYVKNFEQQELNGQDYKKLREYMIALRDAQKNVKEREEDMKKICLESNIFSTFKEPFS